MRWRRYAAGGKERIRHYLDREDVDFGSDAAENIAALHAEKNRLYACRTVSDVALRPGINRLIKQARKRGLALAIATTSSRSNLDVLLAAAFGADGAAWFSAVITGEDVSRKKPDPAAYPHAIGLLGVAPDECVAFEDSRNGLLAAKAAGLPVVLTPSLYTAMKIRMRRIASFRILASPERPLRHISAWKPHGHVIDVDALQLLLERSPRRRC
jgi:HAD superfamily hydrolase (TIGR01509 family)